MAVFHNTNWSDPYSPNRESFREGHSMKRRIVLAGATTALIGGSGCLSWPNSVVSTARSPVSNIEFDVYQPGDENYDGISSVTEPPEISFDSSRDMVVIFGKLFVGSSDCNIASITGRSYDNGSNTFTVTIGSGTKEDAGNACSGDESADTYRIQVEFEGTLPETVTATEEGDPANQSSTVHR